MSFVENINKRNNLGNSRSKKFSTISPKAYKDLYSGWKAAKGGLAKKGK